MAPINPSNSGLLTWVLTEAIKFELKKKKKKKKEVMKSVGWSGTPINPTRPGP